MPLFYHFRARLGEGERSREVRPMIGRCARRLVVTVVLVALFGPGAPGAAQEPGDPGEALLAALREEVPRIASGGERPRRIHLKAAFPTLRCACEVVAEGADRLEMALRSDGADTPWLVAAGGQAILDDPTVEELILLTGVEPGFVLDFEGEDLRIAWILRERSAERPGPAVVLDFPALAARLTAVTAAERIGEGLSRVRARSRRGNEVDLVLASARWCPIASLRLHPAGAEAPAFEIRSLLLDGPERPEGPIRVPATARLHAGGPVKTVAASRLGDLGALATRSALLHAGLADPESRAEVGKILGSEPDWETLGRRATAHRRALAAALRE